MSIQIHSLNHELRNGRGTLAGKIKISKRVIGGKLSDIRRAVQRLLQFKLTTVALVREGEELIKRIRLRKRQK